jgi:hypothetical protein
MKEKIANKNSMNIGRSIRIFVICYKLKRRSINKTWLDKENNFKIISNKKFKNLKTKKE